MLRYVYHIFRHNIFSRNGDGCVERVQEWETFTVPTPLLLV